jgi:hypothetical protein
MVNQADLDAVKDVIVTKEHMEKTVRYLEERFSQLQSIICIKLLVERK